LFNLFILFQIPRKAPSSSPPPPPMAFAALDLDQPWLRVGYNPNRSSSTANLPMSSFTSTSTSAQPALPAAQMPAPAAAPAAKMPAISKVIKNFILFVISF
jgi:hypothetical protein